VLKEKDLERLKRIERRQKRGETSLEKRKFREKRNPKLSLPKFLGKGGGRGSEETGPRKMGKGPHETSITESKRPEDAWHLPHNLTAEVTDTSKREKTREKEDAGRRSIEKKQEGGRS